MRIQFEIKEKLPDIIGEILNSEKWMTLIKEDISGRKLVVIRDQAFDSEATVEIYSREVTIKTAWSRYTYRLFVLGDCVWCEYNGAYRGLLEQKLLPSITPKESLLDSEVLDSSLYGHEKKKLREYAEDNLKLKKFRRENFNENRTGVAPFDHPKKVYDEFIKEDYILLLPRRRIINRNNERRTYYCIDPPLFFIDSTLYLPFRVHHVYFLR